MFDLLGRCFQRSKKISVPAPEERRQIFDILLSDIERNERGEGADIRENQTLASFDEEEVRVPVEIRVIGLFLAGKLGGLLSEELQEAVCASDVWHDPSFKQSVVVLLQDLDSILSSLRPTGTFEYAAASLPQLSACGRDPI